MSRLLREDRDDSVSLFVFSSRPFPIRIRVKIRAEVETSSSESAPGTCKLVGKRRLGIQRQALTGGTWNVGHHKKKVLLDTSIFGCHFECNDAISVRHRCAYW
jgi:hypothetical protein